MKNNKNILYIDNIINIWLFYNLNIKIMINKLTKEIIEKIDSHLEYIATWEWDRLSSSWKEIISQIRKMKISLEPEFINKLIFLDFDIDRLWSSWQEYLNEIFELLEIEEEPTE